MSIALVVGVDGGGSRTRVIIADESGQELATAEGGPSAVRPGEADHSADVIAATVREALAKCEMSEVVPKVLVAGVAGAGRDAERDALWQALLRCEAAEDVAVYADATIALDRLVALVPGRVPFRAPPPVQPVDRDLAVVVDEAV
ncbi:MAG: BadF/BadG/BcrA/BcrD ATPase family protein, partial [Gemmatimonadota bacterium]